MPPYSYRKNCASLLLSIKSNTLSPVDPPLQTKPANMVNLTRINSKKWADKPKSIKGNKETYM